MHYIAYCNWYSTSIPTPPSMIPESDDIDMTDGARKLKELVSKALGGLPVSCIKPELSTSTDDTVSYVFAGKKSKDGGMWKLVKTDDLKGVGVGSSAASSP
jgi:hypothetical protein